MKIKPARCNRCLTRVNDDNSAALDQFGKPLCNDCAYCIHHYALSQDCPACLAMEEELLAGYRPLTEDVTLVL